MYSKNNDYNIIINTIAKQVKAYVNYLDESKDLLNEDIVVDGSWNNKKHDLTVILKNKLKEPISLKFSFRKQNGRLRRANGTCNIDVIRKKLPDFKWTDNAIEKECSNPYLVRYFDMDKLDWRTCDVEKLLIIME